ncbi:hypothetical protein [Helicobacter sp. 11S02596-1]|uniref:hypothetical protein n=1 Tax=Helicobacter sp. 11S02596-1 TaxID=1476194 RepID=UPI000BA53693|nr:hypothetical protein [Helicobacter sp. 11S02596-1]PAF45180.1 hypothetical protein BJI48_01035 [Helicobacter sp. 11S02596-1]
MLHYLNQRLTNLKKHIQKRNFSYIFKRILLPLLPQIPSRFHIEYRFLYNTFVFPQWTKFLKMPQDYSYIIVGSHGVGFVALLTFFERIKANPMPIDNLYRSTDPALLIKSYAKKHRHNLYGISLDKIYMDSHRQKILSKLKHPVPIFCIVRDPICTLRTLTHAFILPLVCDMLKNSKNINGGGGKG